MRRFGRCCAAAVVAAIVLFSVIVSPVTAQDARCPSPSAVPGRETEFGCSALIAGKGTTADGSILFAKTEDDLAESIDFLWFIPRRRHEAGSVVKLMNGGTVPQVAETWAYFWDQCPGTPWSNNVVNEWGVALGSDACPSREDSVEAVAARGDLVDGGIAFELRMIVAERAKTAREGVELAARLLDAYGYYGSGRCLHIVGPEEAWQLQMVRGKQYVARRVRDDEVAITANTYTIREVDMDDAENFVCSPRLIEYAIERGWYEPDSGKPFDFAAAYADPGSYDNPRNTDRTWGMARLLIDDYPLTWEEARKGSMPPAVKPDHKLTLEEVMAIFRDHYEGTALDESNGYEVSPHETSIRTICCNRSHRTTIIQQRDWLPADIGTVVWRALEPPCLTGFVPWYLGVRRIPEEFRMAPVRADTARAARVDFHFGTPELAWEGGPESSGRLFKLMGDLVDEDYGVRIGIVRAAWNKFEAVALALQPEIEKAALKLHQTDESLAREFLTLYSNALAEKSLETARDLIDRMGGAGKEAVTSEPARVE